MPQSALTRLVRILGDQAHGSDSTQVRMPSRVLDLDVAGVGPISLPVRAAAAKRVISVARPARFGRGEDTLADPAVRDTWELTPDQVGLDGAPWRDCLDEVLEQVRDNLGLPRESVLRADLHALLVYGKGQHFLPHQDSEKDDDMVATLVVSLPSVHTGGELVVDDGGREQIFRGSRDDLVFVAFYADRRHEVRPVRSGYRITLTFNLMLVQRAPESAPQTPRDEVAALLAEHFTTAVTSRYGDHDLGEPTRLAFLLDHEYSQRGVAAQRFKGADAERVAVLRAAAERADCECVIGLAEVKETWDVLPEGSWHRDWYDEAHDDELDDELDDDPDEVALELNELIDDEIILDWWLDPADGSRETIELPLADHEVCSVTPSRSLTPYDSEYEGYMGNYGNTLDRWYRRSAVVLWPKDKAFATRAEANPGWAVRTLLGEIRDGDLAAARAHAISLRPFWRRVESDVLPTALEVATGLADPDPAAVVVAPFRMDMLTVDCAPLLVAAARAYGESWLAERVDAWMSLRSPYGELGLAEWVESSLAPLCAAMRDERSATTAGGLVADRVWRWLRSRVDSRFGHDNPERRAASLAELGAPLAAVLEAASPDLGDAITEHLRAAPSPVVELLLPTLRSRPETSDATVRAVAEECRVRLTDSLARPARASDNWSIPWMGCGCQLCDRLGNFLCSPVSQSLDWPLAKRGRQHVHQQIDSAGLLVRHATRRVGRPFTLVLTKSEDLFRREAEARRQTSADLAWLTTTFG